MAEVSDTIESTQHQTSALMHKGNEIQPQKKGRRLKRFADQVLHKDRVPKHERVASLVTSLDSQFNTPERQREFSLNNDQGYLQANDYGLREAYEEALSKFKSDTTTESRSKIRVALIVGNGAIMSFMPDFQEAGIDLVVNLDFSPKVLNLLALEKTTVTGSKSVETLRSKFRRLADDPNEGQMRGETMAAEKFFSASQTRLDQVRRSLEKTAQCSILVNLEDKTDMTNLASLLEENQVEIVLLNTTNALEEPKPRKEALAPVTSLFADYAQCISSNQSTHGHVEGSAITLPPKSLDKFLNSPNPETEDQEAGVRKNQLGQIHAATIKKIMSQPYPEEPDQLLND